MQHGHPRQIGRKHLEELAHAAHAIAAGEISTALLHEVKNSAHNMWLIIRKLSNQISRDTSITSKHPYLEMLAALEAEIQRIESLAKIQQRFTQGLSPHKKITYLNSIVGSVLQLLAGILLTKKLKIELRLDPELDRPAIGADGQPLYVDERQISQALMNIFLNAIDASPARSKLLVETRCRRDGAVFRLSDQGRGIPEQYRLKIFDPFFSTKASGVGLGLYITRILIEENHGGAIELLCDNAGKGTTFEILLPFLDPPQALAAE